jgi:hypothetical protein
MTPSLTYPRTLQVVDEVTELDLMGSVEVECVEGPSHVLDRIICLPPDETGMEVLVAKLTAVLDEEEEEADGIELNDSLLEQLSFAFMDSGCGGCQCAPFKSALRKPRKDSGGDSLSNRNVSFSKLEIHEFDMTLGDHPSAVSGPPIALDYTRGHEENIVDLDEYERSRTPRRKRRQMKLSYRDRKYILEQDHGFSKEEVNAAWLEALKIRAQRRETVRRGLVMMMWDDFSESTERKYNRLLSSVGMSR